MQENIQLIRANSKILKPKLEQINKEESDSFTRNSDVLHLFDALLSFVTFFYTSSHSDLHTAL